MYWAKKGNRVGIQWENTLQRDHLQDDQYEKNSIQHTEVGIRDTVYEECAILQRLSIIIKVF